MWKIIFIFIVAAGSFWFGYYKLDIHVKTSIVENIHPEKIFPITEHKSFVFVMYAHNQSAWCERSLSSIFEQDYDHYRIIVVDDGSSDGTGGKIKQFITENNCEAKVIVIHNETKTGPGGLPLSSSR